MYGNTFYLTSYLPLEQGDASEDEDLEVGGMTVNLRDPLTRAWLDNPMTSYVPTYLSLPSLTEFGTNSKKCRHSYSKDSIYEFLGNRSKQCPAAGCGETISRKDLEPDENLARLVKNAKRREEEERQGVLNRRNTRKENIIIDSDEE
jgi:E3 SUMO-protein ligase NSE2